MSKSPRIRSLLPEQRLSLQGKLGILLLLASFTALAISFSSARQRFAHEKKPDSSARAMDEALEK